MKVLFSSLFWCIIAGQALAASLPREALEDYFRAAKAENMEAYYASQDTGIYDAAELKQRKALTAALWKRFDTLEYRISNVRVSKTDQMALIRFELASRIRGFDKNGLPGEVARKEHLAAVLTRIGEDWKVSLVTEEKSLDASLHALFLQRQVQDTPFDGPTEKALPAATKNAEKPPTPRKTPAGVATADRRVDTQPAPETDKQTTRQVIDYRLSVQWNGAKNGGNNRFKTPSGVAVDSRGFVYVDDLNRRRIQKFSPDGAFIKSFQSEKGKPAAFANSFDLFCGPRDILYVLDGAHKGIVKFTTDLQFIERWNKVVESPYGIAVNREGRVFVVEFYKHRVNIFDPKGKPIGGFGKKGKGNGQFVGPMDIAVDHEGNLFVVDRDGRSVQKFDKNGAFIAKIGAGGGKPGSFNRPWAIAIGPIGNLFITDHNRNSVMKFTNDGRFLLEWGNRKGKKENMRSPVGIAADRSGNIFVAEQGNKVISKYVPVYGERR